MNNYSKSVDTAEQNCSELTISIITGSDLDESDDEMEMVFEMICESGQYKIVKSEVEQQTDIMQVEIKLENDEEELCDKNVKIKNEPLVLESENVTIKEELLESENIEIKEEIMETEEVFDSCDVATKQLDSLNTEATKQTPAVTSKRKYKCTYKCPHCAERFETKALRKPHIRNHRLEIFNISEINSENGALRLKCRLCEKTWSRIRKNSMQKHALQHRSKQQDYTYYDGVWAPGREYTKYACPECNLAFVSQTTWNTHIQNNHNFFEPAALNFVEMADGQKQCHQCGQNVKSSAAQMQKHKLLHMPHKSFICVICSERKYWFVDISQHIRKKHFTQGQFECGACKKVFKTQHQCWLHCRKVHKVNNTTNLIKKKTAPKVKRQYNVNKINNLTANAVLSSNIVKEEPTIIANNCSNSYTDYSDEIQRPTVMERIALRRHNLSQYVNDLKKTRVINPKKIKRKLFVWNWNDDGAEPEYTLSCNIY